MRKLRLFTCLTLAFGVAACATHQLVRTSSIGSGSQVVTGNDTSPPARAKAAKAPATLAQAPAFLKAVQHESEETIAFLGNNCIGCHDAETHSGDVILDRFTDAVSIRKDRRQWAKILTMVEGGAMPPKEAPAPSKAARESFIKNAKTVLNYTDPANPDPGRVTVRRLNRTEYDNSVYDLTGIPFYPSAEFPPDDVSGGYDNNGDGLILSPIQMERYLSAAEATMEAVLPEKGYWPLLLKIENQWRIPNGSFSQTAIGRANIRNIPAGQRLWMTRAITTEGEYLFRSFSYWHKGDGLGVPKLTLEVYKDTGGGNPGEQLVNHSVDVDVIGYEGSIFYDAPPVHLKPGNYIFSLMRTLRDGETAPPPPQVLSGKDEIPGLYARWAEISGPFTTDVPLMAHKSDAKPRDAAREVIERFASKAYRRPVTEDEINSLVRFYDHAPGVDKITGAFTPTSSQGLTWYQAVRPALTAVLVSSKFLYRVEDDPAPEATGPHRITDFQLASRLSYFIWSGPPDEPLLTLAAKNELHNHIEEQVRRMLKDPRADALTDNFAEQWLHLRMLKKVTPDTQKFPDYSETLSNAMRNETLEFFRHVVSEDKSILDLVDGPYTYLNGPLAKFYGIVDTNGNGVGQAEAAAGGTRIPTDPRDPNYFKFIKVELQPNTRSGVLTQASLLTITSNPGRTSPVKRGKFVMEQFLGESPPPPPPNVPALDDHKELTGNLRQRMEQHRADPRCAACHQEMDQIGFAFENFNAIGTWRAKDDDAPIDASGVLPTGEKFQGPSELKAVLRAKSGQFVGCFTEQLMTYALGRKMQYYDQPAIDKITATAAASDYHFSSIVVAICNSQPFLMRRGKDQTDE